MNKNIAGSLLTVIIVIIVGVGFYELVKISDEPKKVNSFEECAAAGNPVMESYPRQCKTKVGRMFYENIPTPSVFPILPADSESPAAGICAEAGEEDVVIVEINLDVPSPRCQKVVAGKRLVIKNNTDETLSMWFGKNKEYSFSVSANDEYAIPELVDNLLSPGVHSLYGAPYQGPEIWLIVDKTPYFYHFKDFSASEVYAGVPAEVNFLAYPAAKNFKTKVTEGAKFGPNFAGHYTVVEWGCGTSCQMHAIVDVKTGSIIEFGLGSVLGLEYKLDSRLLILNPPSELNNLGEISTDTVIAAEYYEMKDNRLSILARQTPSEAGGMICAQMIIRAKNIYTNEERDFPTPCSVPNGWQPITVQNGNGILPYDSGVSGTVSIGPICPVVKNPSDPACADKPYKTTVQVILINSPKSSPFATTESDDQGRYKIMLPPGEYALQPVGKNPLPRCETKNITVEPKMVKELNLACDTGIR